MSAAAPLTVPDASATFVPTTETPFTLIAPLPINTVIASFHITCKALHDVAGPLFTFVVPLAGLGHAKETVTHARAFRCLFVNCHLSTAGEFFACLAVGTVHDPPHVIFRPPVANRSLAVAAGGTELDGL